jgi:Tfp pilus assembly protein PilX
MSDHTWLHQSGAALVMAMLMLLMLSFLGAIVLSNANMDLKMTSAAGSRLVAVHQAEGALNAITSDATLSTTIATMTKGQVIDTSTLLTGSLGDLEMVTEVECKRSYEASSTNALPSCRYVRLELNQTYGKAGVATTSVHAGLEQPLLD